MNDTRDCMASLLLCRTSARTGLEQRQWWPSIESRKGRKGEGERLRAGLSRLEAKPNTVGAMNSTVHGMLEVATRPLRRSHCGASAGPLRVPALRCTAGQDPSHCGPPSAEHVEDVANCSCGVRYPRTGRLALDLHYAPGAIRNGILEQVAADWNSGVMLPTEWQDFVSDDSDGMTRPLDRHAAGLREKIPMHLLLGWSGCKG